MHRYHWLEKLHNTHYATLLMIAQNRLRSTTGSTSEAEDVVQEVFLLAAEKNIQDLPNPLGWMIKTTGNLCRKRVDQVIRDGEKAQRFIQDKLNQSEDRSIYAIEREESKTNTLLWVLLLEQALSTEDWDIMRKYCIEGIPIEEIAAGMDMPVNRLKVKIHRIRRKFEKICRDV